MNNKIILLINFIQKKYFSNNEINIKSLKIIIIKLEIKKKIKYT